MVSLSRTAVIVQATDLSSVEPHAKLKLGRPGHPS